MKKRFALLFLVALFSISVANAEIVFNNDFTKFNLGDKATIEGYIESNENVRGIIRFYLDCEDSTQLSAKVIKVEANKRYLFDEDVNLFTGEGQCNFRVKFDDESKSSNTFEIVDDLKGNLFVSEINLRLGDPLDITGDIFKINNDKFDGIGIIYFNIDNETYYIDTFEIFGGNVEYSILPENLPPKTYSLELEAFDFYGNKEMFYLGNLNINDDLFSNIMLSKQEYLPGEQLDISGNVDSNDYKISFKLDDEIYESSFDAEDFNYFFKIKDNIKSGAHKLNAEIIDKYGNHYEEELELTINGIPKKLEVKTDKGSYPPESTVEIFSAEYDQGEDIYNDAINLAVIDPEKNELLNVDISSGAVYGLKLGKYADPGSYMITSKTLNFKKDIFFTVEGFEEINVIYDERDNRLKVSNEGNIPIDDYINVGLNNNLYDFDLKIKPSEVEIYDLRGYINEDGVYDMVVTFKGNSYDVSANIIDNRDPLEKLTGSVVSNGGNGGWIVYLLILVIVILVLYLFLKKPNDYAYRERDYREGQEKLRRVREQKGINKPKKMFQGKEIDKEEAKDFRESMVKRMKER